MSQNLISQTMTDAQRDAMIADLDSFDTKFDNYKCLLTPEQIARLSKIKEEDVALLDSALTYAQQNPNSIPANINVTELAKDIALAKQLVQVNAKAQQKANLTACSLIATMSDGFVTGRAIYRLAQSQGRTPDSTAFLDAFGARFAHGPQATPLPGP